MGKELQEQTWCCCTPLLGEEEGKSPPGATLGTARRTGGSSLSQALTPLPTFKLLQEPRSKSLSPKNLKTTLFVFLFYTAASLASRKPREIKPLEDKQQN